MKSPRRFALLLFVLPCVPMLDASEPAAPSASIETRQAGFKKMGAALKALNDQMKAASPDPAVLARASAAISAGADAQKDWFPSGSGPESGIETDALPNIWTDRTRFDALTAKLVEEARLLGERVNAGDTAALAAQVKAVGAACSSCHRSFRAD